MNRVQLVRKSHIFNILALMLIGVLWTPQVVQAGQHQGELGKSIACDFAQTTLLGSEAIADKYYALSAKFSEANRNAIRVKLRDQLKSFDIYKTEVFTLVDLGGLYTHYLLVSASRDSGPLFFRIEMYALDGQPTMWNFLYNSSYEEALRSAVTQTAIPIDCSS